MAVNYNDPRFTAVEDDKKQALNNVNKTYDNMINSSDKFYNDQKNLIKDYETTQKDIQQQQSDLTIQKIEQQKQQANQDYTKEQKASYADYRKQSNEYGANAEAMASRGLNYTGYAETTNRDFYTTYQNRYAVARETYNRAVLNYDNAIKDAQLANSSALAEISFKSMQQQLEIALEGFQYKNTLLQTQLQMQNDTEDRYYKRWQDVQTQINTENALAEQIRQYNESLALERDKFNWQKQQQAIENARYSIQQSNGGSSGSSSKKDSSDEKQSASIEKTNSVKKTDTKESSSSGTVKLSNNKTGYSNWTDAVLASSAKGPLRKDTALKQGYIKTVEYQRKTYYYPAK